MKLLLVILVLVACDTEPPKQVPLLPFVAPSAQPEPPHERLPTMHTGKEAIDTLRTRCRTDPNRGVSGELHLVEMEGGACATCWSGKCFGPGLGGCMEDKELWTQCMSLTYFEEPEK